MSATVDRFVHFLYYHFLKVLFNQVSQAEWGAGEPGLVGECAVIDSGMKWSWNAIGYCLLAIP